MIYVNAPRLVGRMLIDRQKRASIMKRIFGLLLLLVAFNASAIEITSKLSGSWYNSSQAGHGLNVAILDRDSTLFYWYTYHTDGTPMFLVTIGTNDGSRTSGTTYYNTGMKFGDFDPNDVSQTVWGTSAITFDDCNNATFEYSADDPAYGSGSMPMVRLASVSGVKCSVSPLHGTYTASIVEQGEAGFGLATLFENGDMVYFAGSGVYAAVGLGQWRVTGSNRFTFDATSYSVTGGWFDVSGNGTFNEDALTATYTGNGQLAATPIPSFQHSLDTSKLAGSYTIYDGSDSAVGSATVQSDGRVSGSTYLGCQFSGAFYVPNTNFNQAYIDVDVSSCGDTVSIIGSAVYNNPQNAIVVAAVDGWYGYIWTLK
jgi:hypothetical protein